MIKNLEYHSAHDLAEALELASRFGAGKRFLAGGTDMMVRLKEGLVREEVMVDLSRVAELHGIHEEAGVLHIGAGVTHAELAASALVLQHGRALAQAAGKVGGPQIRNMGTIGGNLANASPAGDTIPALVVLDGDAVLASTRGLRTVPVIDFCTGPGRTVLAPDEVITEVRFKAAAPGECSGFAKLGTRQAMTIATASVACWFRVEQTGRVREARIAFGSLAPTVIRAPKTEQIFCALPPVLSWDAVRGAAQMAWKEVAPIDDLRASAVYRREAAVGLLAQCAWELLSVGVT